MSGETEQQVSGWTVDTLRVYHEALRDGDLRFESERDRRYTEVARVKDAAELRALNLAREIQAYKDEKANELRSQIEGERGTYPTRLELTAAVEKIEESIKPLGAFVTAQQGRSEGVGTTTKVLFSSLAALGVIVGLWFGTHTRKSRSSCHPSP